MMPSLPSLQNPRLFCLRDLGLLVGRGLRGALALGGAVLNPAGLWCAKLLLDWLGRRAAQLGWLGLRFCLYVGWGCFLSSSLDCCAPASLGKLFLCSLPADCAPDMLRYKDNLN